MNDVRVGEAQDRVLTFDEDLVDNTEFTPVELTAPGNAPLEAGTYTDVRRYATATNPGLLNSIERDPATGRLTDVEVEQRCGAPDAPAFTRTRR